MAVLEVVLPSRHDIAKPVFLISIGFLEEWDERESVVVSVVGGEVSTSCAI